MRSDAELTTAASAAVLVTLGAITAAFVVISLREAFLVVRSQRRIARWRRAGIAREPGEVIVFGRVWTDDTAPIARVPVYIHHQAGQAMSEQPTGPAWSRPFWLATDLGDIAIDAHQGVAEVETTLLAGAPLGATVHEIVGGEAVEVFGRLRREHVAGAVGEFRDGATSYAIHGDEAEPIHIAAAGSLARTGSVRIACAAFTAFFTVLFTWLTQGLFSSYEAAFLGSKVSNPSDLHISGDDLGVGIATLVGAVALITALILWRRPGFPKTG